MSSQVSEPRMPTLSSLGPVVKPFQPRSTMNAVMPLGPLVGDVLAY